MDRFYGEDEEKPFFGFESEFDEDDMDGMEEEAMAFIQNPDMVQVILAQDELRHHLLEKAIHIAESGWFWRFKRPMAKMIEIELIYKSLQIITADPDDEDE